MSRSQPVNLFSKPRWVVSHLVLALLAACGGDISEASELGARAQQQLDEGQILAARESIVAAINERDDLAALQLLRGRIELAGNRIEPAYEAFSAALALEATNLEALQGVAQLGLRAGHIAESENAAERILALQPEQPDALLVLGLLSLVRGRPGKAVEAADRILAVSPGDEGGLILKARALYMLGEGPRALAFLNETIPAAGRSESVAKTRLELLREVSDSKGMREELAALRRQAPKDLELLLDEANLLYKIGEAALGRNLLLSALFELKLNAGQTRQIAALWREYDREPLLPKEIGAFAKTANEAAKVEIARHYLDSGRPKVARMLLSGGRSLEARALASRTALALGEIDSGASSAERVLAFDGTQCDALLARSAARSLARRWADAVIAAQTAATECPQNAAATIALAQAYEGKRDPAGVRRAFAEGIARNPQNPVLSQALIAWLEAKHDSRQAIGEARRLTRKAPASTSAWASYRDVCVRQKDHACLAEARDGLTRAGTKLGIDLAPGTALSRSLIGRLPPR